MTNATSRVKGRCGREELSEAGKPEDNWAASIRAGAMAASCWDELYVPDLFLSWWRCQPRVAVTGFVRNASSTDKVGCVQFVILGGQMS